MISICITGLSDSAIAVVAGALQGAGVAPAQAAQRDAELSFASWHARVYQAAEQSQQEHQDGAAAEAAAPTLGRLWDQLASDLFLSNIQTPVWGWADAKSLGLLDYWLAFDSSIHFVLVATSPEQMLAEQLTDLTLADASATKALSAIPVDGLMARWNQAHHAMLRFALRNPARCMLVLADDLSEQVLVDAAKESWPKALKALRVPQKDATSAVPELGPSSSDRVLRHFAEQWSEAYPQAKTLHQEIASVAAVANTKNSEKQASDAVLQDVLATLALARKVPLLHAQANDAARLLEARLKDEAELKIRLEQEVSAKTKTMAALSEEKSQRKSADEERALLLTQLHQVQEDLESYYLKCKELDKEVKSLGNAQRDLEAQAKANAELKEKLEEERKARAASAGENAKLAQEKTKLIEARDSLVHARAQVQEKLNEAGTSRAEVVQEKIVLSQKNKELIAARDAEIKLKVGLQAKLEDELKAKSVLADENAKLAQEKAKLMEARDSLILARAQVQEKLNEAGKSRTEVVQEKIALSQKNKELIAARDAEAKAKNEAVTQLEKEVKIHADLEVKLQAKRQALDTMREEKSALAQENKALAQEKISVSAAYEALTKVKTEALDDLAKAHVRAKMAEEESTLMLARLHKLQEDAQRYEVRLKDLQAESEQEKTKLIEARDAQTKARTETQEKLNEAGKARAAIVQEKMALSEERKEAIAARDAETKAKAAALEQLAKAQARTKMAEEESAQMLAQLHKLQEDAERYDLRIKGLQANLNQATARFRRVTSRQPDGIDWESVQTQPVMVDGRPALQCRATNVAVMGKEWKSLAFVAFIQDGTLAFTFLPNPDAAGLGPLTRLPRGLGSLAQFTASAGREIPGQPGMELLKDLSTSDWDLLRGLPRLVSLGLQYVRGAWPVDMPGPAAWENAAKATLPALLRVPAALRFDVLKLQSAATQANYEHLRLWLDPLSLGNKRFAGFEFRFGCNVGQGSQFGANARLEFFRGSGTSTFDQWVPNARDGDHERLDLVFVFPTSMNIKDWSALSVNDRCLVLLLADQLPTMLAEMGSSSVQTTRPMSEWVDLAQKLRSFVRARLDVTGIQKQPDALVDAVPGSVPQTGLNAPAKRRTALPSSVVSDIKKPRAATKAPLAAKKPVLRIQSTGSAVRAEPARARKK